MGDTINKEQFADNGGIRMARMVGIIHESTEFAADDGSDGIVLEAGSEVLVEDGWNKGKDIMFEVSCTMGEVRYTAEVPYSKITPRIEGSSKA